MIRMCQIFLLLISFAFCIFAQDNLQSNDFEKLAEQISSAATIEDIKQIISKAENLYKEKKKQVSNNQEELAKTTIDFALFRKHIFDVMNEKRSELKSSTKKVVEFYSLIDDNSKKLYELLENSIKIYEQVLKIENAQLATAKFELAKFSEIYTPPSKISFSWDKRLEKLYKIQDLYLQSLLLREKFLNKNDDLILITTFYLANNYIQSADFEKALPLYEKFISGIEEKYGRKSEALLPALLMSVAIWKMIGRQELVEKFTKQISEITNEQKDLSDTFLLLSPRAKSFKYNGINKPMGRIVFTNSIRTLGDDIDTRSPNSVTEPTIRENSMRNNPNYSLVIPVLTETSFPNAIATVVTIDESGKIIDLQVKTDDSKIRDKVAKEVKTWEFKPFVYEGMAMKIKGLIYYYN